MKARALALAALAGMCLAGRAEAGDRVPEIIVTAPADLLGDDEATVLAGDDLRRAEAPGLPAAIARNLAGASLSEAQGNPYQPNLVYRGFTASPLQGNAQGLAVYVDGVRFNQPFGDTVDFDLLPDDAIESVSIREASPAYGLNALGGALVVATATGRSAPGPTGEAAIGDHGRRSASATAGWAGERASGFLAAQAEHDGGWRQHSPSTLTRLFGDFGWDAADAGIHVKLALADTDLTGNGAAPVELLAARRVAVFTYPDNTRNRYRRVSLHPWLALDERMQLKASLAFQALRQHTVNGDTADIEGCEADAALLCLEAASDEADDSLLRDASGALVASTPGVADYGLLNRSNTRSDSWNALVQLTDGHRLFGRDNTFAAGFSLDHARTRFSSSSELGELTAARSVIGLGPIIAQPDGAIAPVRVHVATDYWGLFLSDRLALGGGFSVEGGLRWNTARIRLDDALGSALDGRHVYRRLDPGIELGYRASPGLALRLRYSEANRAPTPAELSCADESAPCSLTNFFVGDPHLAQVVTRSWSAGAQGRIAGAWHGTWSLAAYRSDNGNDIQFTSSAIRGRAFFRNVGNTRRQGIEANLTLSRGGWSIHAGYAFTAATFRTSLVLNSPDNPSADEAGHIFVKPGDRIPSIPRHRGIVSVDYKAPAFALGGDVQLQSGQYFSGDEANADRQLSGFAVFGIHGSVTLAGRLRLFGSVSNLFNRRYASFGTYSGTGDVDLAEAPGASDPHSVSPGAPRRWRIGLRLGI